jgi:hypothetical protein
MNSLIAPQGGKYSTRIMSGRLSFMSTLSRANASGSFSTQRVKESIARHDTNDVPHFLLANHLFYLVILGGIYFRDRLRRVTQW